MEALQGNNQFFFLQSQKNRVHLIVKTGEHYEGILDNIDIQSNRITLGQIQQVQPQKELQEKTRVFSTQEIQNLQLIQQAQPQQPEFQPPQPPQLQDEEKEDSEEESEDEEEEEKNIQAAYQNKDSFFDNISTSASHPMGMGMQNPKQLDQETFGADYFKVQRSRGRRPPRRNNYNNYNNQRNYNRNYHNFNNYNNEMEQNQQSSPNSWVIKRQQYRKEQQLGDEDVVENVNKKMNQMNFNEYDLNQQQELEEDDDSSEWKQPFAIANRYNNQGRRNFRGQRGGGGNRRGGGYRRNQFRGRGRGGQFPQEFE